MGITLFCEKGIPMSDNVIVQRLKECISYAKFLYFTLYFDDYHTQEFPFHFEGIPFL